ncbi:unnamed protein product [Gadus morhua 'NCC']
MEQTCSIHSLELCSHSPSRGHHVVLLSRGQGAKHLTGPSLVANPWLESLPSLQGYRCPLGLIRACHHGNY